MENTNPRKSVKLVHFQNHPHRFLLPEYISRPFHFPVDKAINNIPITIYLSEEYL